MKIIINSSSLINSLTGIGNYTYQVSKWLSVLFPEHEYTYYYLGRFLKSLTLPSNYSQSGFFLARRIIDKMPLIGFITKWFWRYFRDRLAGKMNHFRFDIYFEPGALPVEIHANKTVVTIHDLSFYLHPEWHLEDASKYMKRQLFYKIPRVDRIITVSNAIREELIGILPVDGNKISVIYNGVEHEIFREYPDDVLLAYTRQKSLPEKFLLYVGSIEPRKNLIRLLDAYAELPSNIRKDVKLILIGFKGWKNKAIMERILRLSGDVQYLGYVSKLELAYLYNLATAFIYPSLYEGFGLPPLEAMACGAPVLLSGIAVHREIYGQAAIYFDPTDVEEMLFKIIKILADTKLRKELKEAGKILSSQFSWEKSARQHLAVFESV